MEQRDLGGHDLDRASTGLTIADYGVRVLRGAFTDTSRPHAPPKESCPKLCCGRELAGAGPGRLDSHRAADASGCCMDLAQRKSRSNVCLCQYNPWIKTHPVVCAGRRVGDETKDTISMSRSCQRPSVDGYPFRLRDIRRPSNSCR